MFYIHRPSFFSLHERVDVCEYNDDSGDGRGDNDDTDYDNNIDIRNVQLIFCNNFYPFYLIQRRFQ
jgi:hypothetical protein